MSARARVDGVPVAAAEAHVAALDRGFLHGDAVFEVYRVYDGRPFDEEAHLARLAASARRLRMALPVPPEVLAEEVRATLRESGLREAHVRVVVSRGPGGGGLVPSDPTRPTRVVLVGPVQAPAEEAYRDGVTACFAPSPHWLAGVGGSGAKVCNYVDGILSLVAARAQGAHEALFTDPHGQVLEGASSNVFVVRRGCLATPPLESGILGGITRDRVLELAERRGVPAAPRCLFPRDLYDADEVFLTSSIREVLPVVAVDGAPIGAGRPGPLTRALHEAYREAVRATGRASSG